MKVGEKQKIILRIISGIVLLPACLFLSVSCQRPEKQASPPEKITIAYTANFNPVLVHIAFAKGFFKEEGLDATPQPHAFGKPALQAILEGKADIATTADTPIMFAVMDGRKIAILATIQTAGRNEGIVARRDRGISKPSDLKGKTIGATRGTTSDFFTETFLIVHGIGRKQVTIIDLKPDEMAAALATGKLDAAATWHPTLAQLQKGLGTQGLIFYGETIYTEAFCVVAGQDFIKQHPGAVRKFLRALIKAEAFVKQHPEEARRLVTEFIKADKALLDEIWDIYNFRVTLDQPLLVSLEEQTRWAIKNRLTQRREMPNYLDFIDADSLRAVKPEVVRIIW
jgi:ABC-type nitrate/sulfonate/bicarbonate transport system substrate-binding protein